MTYLGLTKNKWSEKKSSEKKKNVGVRRERKRGYGKQWYIVSQTYEQWYVGCTDPARVKLRQGGQGIERTRRVSTSDVPLFVCLTYDVPLFAVT